MRPDEIDVKIIEALMQDGRASLSQIARRTWLTTPTVSARMARMTKAGLIKRFVPVLSSDAVNRGVIAILTLKVGAASTEKASKDLAKLQNVESVYTTTGQAITLKVALDAVQDLQSFVEKNVSGRPGLEVVSSQIVTSVVKEEPPHLIPSALTMDLRCDFCKGEVNSSRPYTFASGPSHYYFCCRTCKKDYLEKHRLQAGDSGPKASGRTDFTFVKMIV